MPVFLFTDIEGSTRLWERHRTDMGAVIARHDAILHEQITASDGQVTKHTGDGVTAAFGAGDPLACALKAQLRFASESWGPVGELRIRVGLHAGEAEWLSGPDTGSGDYFGPPVNCTARVMSAAWGGQVLLTPRVTATAALPSRASLLDLGEHLLKDVSAPQQIFQLVHPDLPRTEFPPPRSLSGQSINQVVDQQGQRLAALDSEAMLIGLVGAVLLPAVLGDPSAASPALNGNLGVLHDLGAGAVAEFLAGFAARRPGGEAEQIREQLEAELRQGWHGEGTGPLALRTGASLLFQAVQGVTATMTAASGEVKVALAQGLAGLGDTLVEFRWMLGDLQETLAEMRARQALQLALQREQLDLQRQQLVKTNLLLRRQELEVVRLPAAESVQTAVQPQPPADVACPYKGLAAFEAEDAGYFFGREELVAELTARLAGTRFLAVVGPSGSGKSSIVRAGLLPAIWGGALPGSRAWQTLVLTPGAHPLEELAVRLSLLRGVEASALLAALRARPEALHLAVQQVLAGERDSVQFLLVVDQFEEIFALCHSEAERGAFIEALLHAVEAEGGRTVVVPTIRADFYGRCAVYPRLAALMSDGLLVGPMSVPELRQAIERPAGVSELRLEPGLVKTIVGDVADEPGSLPLLSHALLETFARRQGRTLTLSAYAASGGVAGAIAQTADAVYDGLDEEDQPLAQSIFLQLTELGEEGSQDTRRRVSPAALVRTEEEASRVAALLRTLAAARLVTMGGPIPSSSRGGERPSGKPVLSSAHQDPEDGTVEVAHEALIREWGRLREWLDECRDDLRAHRRLTAASAEWIESGKDEGYLLRGSRLDQFEIWARDTDPALTPAEEGFLESSIALREKREAEQERQRVARARAEAQARRSQQLRRLAAALAVVLVLAIAAAVFALIQRGQSQQSLRLSESHRLTAAAINNLGSYPERSVLLALEAMSATYAADQTVAREADAALRRALESLRVQHTLFGHGGPVYGVAFSPDGACLATASGDRKARVWDSETGAELLALSGHSGLVRSVAFGPANRTAGMCGAYLATAGDDGAAIIWSLPLRPNAPAEEARAFTDHTGPLWSVALSPDGTRLATASEDGTAKIWDASTGQELWTLTGHAGPVYSLAFSAEGTRLATASEDGTARVWKLPPAAATSVEEPLIFEGHGGPVYAVVFSPDGTRLATAGGDGSTRVWLLASGATDSGGQPTVPSGHSGPVRGLAFSPDGTRLVSTGTDETVKVWQVGTSADARAQKDLTLLGHTGPVYGAAFSPDGSRLATASEDRTAKVWDVSASGNESARSEQAGTVWSVAFSPDGTRLATASEYGAARLWSLDSSRTVVGQELLALSGHTAQVNTVAFSSDGTRLSTASDDGTAKVWLLSSGAVVAADEMFTLTGHDGWVMSVAFSPDGTRLATASLDGTAKLWAAGSGQQLHNLANHSGWVIAVAFSPDGTHLATASYDGTAKIWETVSGRESLTLSGHKGILFGVAFSPDGKRLATAGEDGTARIWSLASTGASSGKELLVLSGHTDWVLAVAFSPDGMRLATASADGTARIWDAASGEELLAFAGGSDLVNGIAFSPDGTRLAATGASGMVRVYVLDAGELMTLACDSLTRNLTEAEWQSFLGRDIPYRRTCPDLPVPPAWLTYGHLD